MLPIQIAITGLSSLEKTLGAKIKAERKALNTAVKVEGFRLRKEMASDIRKGSPGGQPFAPRTYLSKAYSGRPNQKALARLAVSTRYFIPEHDPITMHIGWTGPQVSKSWKRLAKMHQEGFTAPVDDKRRQYLIKIISQKGKRSIYRKFIPRASTTTFKTPARPIIAPFWAAHKSQALRNIRNNYRRKLAGERI
jgi:hypothetical protein